MKKTCIFITLAVIFLSGCTIPFAPLNNSSPTPPARSIENTPTATSQIEALPPQPAGQQLTLVIWLPDSYAVHNGDQVQNLLGERLETFQSNYPEISVDLRLKNITNRESLLELLNTTNRAAPALMPDLVLLNQGDLETAALKGLLVPLESTTSETPPAVTLPVFGQPGRIQGSTFGFPAAGDALLVTGEPGSQGSMNSWGALASSGKSMSVNLNDPLAVVVSMLYIADGGRISDDQARPYLDPDTLTGVLTTLRSAAESGLFSENSLLAAEWEDISREYDSGRTDLQVNWYSSILPGTPVESYYGLPGIRQGIASLATAWFWASSTSDTAKIAARDQLLAYISNPDFSSPWSIAAGYLPVADEYWASSSSSLAPVGAILKNAIPLPENTILVTLGTILRDAAMRACTTSDPIEEIVTAATARINQ